MREIIVAHSIKDLHLSIKKLKQDHPEILPENCIILLDLDDNVFMPAGDLGGETWLKVMMARRFGNLPSSTTKPWHQILQKYIKMRPVENETVDIINELLAQGYKIVPFTARSNTLRDATAKQLQSIGINMDNHKICADFIVKGIFAYERGILFCDSKCKDKGIVWNAFATRCLQHLNILALFGMDDGEHHLKNIWNIIKDKIFHYLHFAQNHAAIANLEESAKPYQDLKEYDLKKGSIKGRILSFIFTFQEAFAELKKIATQQPDIQEKLKKENISFSFDFLYLFHYKRSQGKTFSMKKADAELRSLARKHPEIQEKLIDAGALNISEEEKRLEETVLKVTKEFLSKDINRKNCPQDPEQFYKLIEKEVSQKMNMLFPEKKEDKKFKELIKTARYSLPYSLLKNNCYNQFSLFQNMTNLDTKEDSSLLERKTNQRALGGSIG